MARLLTRRRGEEGASLVMALAITLTVFILGGVWLRSADHQSSASVRDRDRQRAVDAANAGLVVAASKLAASAAYSGTPVTTFAGGAAQYEVTVAVDSTNALRRIIAATGYAPSKTAATRTKRTMVQVVELQPSSPLPYTLFAIGSVNSSSSSSVAGNVYAAGSVNLGNADRVTGGVDALGSLTIGSNRHIVGDVRANGSISISPSADVTGSVYAGGSISVANSATVTQTAQAASAISGCDRVFGACLPWSAPPVLAVQPLPTFTWSASDDSEVQTWTATAFKAWIALQPTVSGVHYVTGSLDVLPNKLRLGGDLTIVVTGSVNGPKTIENATSHDLDLRLISSTGGSYNFPTNLTIASSIHSLIYTTGSISFGNSTMLSGAVYTGGSVNVGANSTITRVDVDTTGFSGGAASNGITYSLRNISTREVAATG
jgi:Tfp pilus assembly protein PilX